MTLVALGLKVNGRLCSKICNRKKKNRLSYAKYVRTEKDKNQLLATTLSFLKASMNQAGRQTTSLSVVNNPYDRITSANTSSTNLQSWQHALNESTKRARALSPTITYTQSSTHAHTHTHGRIFNNDFYCVFHIDIIFI